MRLSWKIVTPVVLILGVIAWLTWRTLQPASNVVKISTVGLQKCDVDKKEILVGNGESLNWTPDAGHTYQVIFDAATGTPVGASIITVPGQPRTVNGTSGKKYPYTINVCTTNDCSTTNPQCKNVDPHVILK